MKIVFTGGGTGGHFYPIIAIAQEVNRLAKERHLVAPQLFFCAPSPIDEGLLYDNHIRFVSIPAGKLRLYFSLAILKDIVLAPYGMIKAFLTLLKIFPDVVFSKGGYGSFPTLLSARLLRIPVIIHESDSVPGRANAWAGSFAHRVALSYPEAAVHFKKAPIAVTGNPIRIDIQKAATETGKQFFAMDPSIPTLLILGGSQGSQTINDIILSILPDLVKQYYVIHQTGPANFTEVTQRSRIALEQSENTDRYKPYANLNAVNLKMAAGAASLIISRAGSTIFEIAQWGIPSIIIPITITNGDHQRKNAFTYARSGACRVIEENNLKPHVLLANIEAILSDKTVQEQMRAAAQSFSTPHAAEKIAEALLEVGISHQS